MDCGAPIEAVVVPSQRHGRYVWKLKGTRWRLALVANLAASAVITHAPNHVIVSGGKGNSCFTAVLGLIGSKPGDGTNRAFYWACRAPTV